MVPNGWEEKSLKDICQKTISYGIVQTGENIQNGVPCVRVVDLSKNTLNPVEMIKTSDKIHQSYKKTILCEGELMMALRGEIGLVKKVTPELVGANITRGLARLSPIKSVDSDYLLWTLRSNKIKNELSRKSSGSALQEIALGSLRKVVLPIPPLPEQRKIAQILSTWDRGIATTEKLIDASKQQKKALMQQLLTGKKRLVNPETGKAFEGEWEEVKLSYFFDRVTEKNKGQSTNVVTISAQHGLIRQEEFFKKSVASETLDNYFILRKGQFAYNKSYSNGYPIGAIKRLNRYEDAVVTSLYICFELKNEQMASSCFMEQYFESGLLNRGLTKVAAEGACPWPFKCKTC